MLTVKRLAYIALFSTILGIVCVFGICKNFDGKIVQFSHGTQKLSGKSTLSREDGCSDREMPLLWVISTGFMVVFARISEMMLEETERVRNDVQPLEQQPVHVQQPVQLPRIFPKDEKASIPLEECLICIENKRIYTALPCGHLIACASCKQQIETRRCPMCNAENKGWLRTFY